MNKYEEITMAEKHGAINDASQLAVQGTTTHVPVTGPLGSINPRALVVSMMTIALFVPFNTFPISSFLLEIENVFWPYQENRPAASHPSFLLGEGRLCS